MYDLKLTDFLTKEIVGPFVIVIGCVLLYIALKNLITKAFKLKLKVSAINYRKQKTLSSILTNLLKYIMFMIALLMLLELYGIDTKTILASIGLVGVVAGLALQDIAKDFIAGFSIIFEDQYNVGDTISIGDFKGEVLSLGLKTTVIKKYTGEVKVICNRNITEVVNFSKQFTVEHVNIPVSYGADLKKVDEVLTKVLEEISKETPDLMEPMQLLGVNSFEDSSVNFLVSMTTKPMKHFAIKRALLRRVKEVFDENNIEIPFQQVVVHNE